MTGLRGLAALLVLLHHFYLHFLPVLQPSLLSPMLRKGYLGVDLFFTLSGFVLAMVYGPWFAPSALAWPGRPGWPRRVALFLLRRGARLWPLHAIVLLGVLATMALDGVHVSGRTVLANLGMIQAWGISTEINPPAWSVSTEWFAYLIFPFLAPLILRARFGVLIGLAGIVALVAADMLLAPDIGNERRGPLDIYYNYSLLPLMRCLAGFILGMATWRIGQLPAVNHAFANRWVGPAALSSMLILMFTRTHDLLIYPLIPLVVLGFHLGTGPAWRLLATGPLYRLGVVSYAFYLVHLVLLAAFPFGWGPLQIELAAYLATTLAVAWALHCMLERPARGAIRRWGEAALSRLGPQGRTGMPLQGDPG